MFIGGAERSLLGLLGSFDYEKYQVDLMLYRHEGEFLDYIPKEVNILEELEEYTTFDRPIKDLLFSKLYKFGIARIIAKLRLKLYCFWSKEEGSVWKSLQYIYNTLTPLLPKIQGQYDLAINFLGLGDIIADKVNANKKITWIHTDYSILNPHKKMDLKLFNKIDYIATVSEECERQLLKIYPQLKNKSIVIENILSKKFIQDQSLLDDETEDMIKINNEIIFLSVGRFSEAKNFDNVPQICKYLIDEGFNIKWYVIGYGGDENLIRQKVDEYHMNDYVIILGKKVNPYPYIKKCDFYLQPSRYEGKAVTVREAQILGKICIITNFETAKSQIVDEYDGIIVPMDNKECAYAISTILRDKEIQKSIKHNLSNESFENIREIEKIYEMINEEGL